MQREMKFGALLDYALKEGFSALATGHYCRRVESPCGEIQLWEGKDKDKDQSYFLSRITSKQLHYARFPLGGMEKRDVRSLARKYNLPVADKKDSQGICFLGKSRCLIFIKFY